MKKFILAALIILLITLIFVNIKSKHEEIIRFYTPNFKGVQLNQYLPSKFPCSIHYAFDHYAYCSTGNVLVLININTMKIEQAYLTPEHLILIGDYIIEHGIPDSYTIYCNAYWLFYKDSNTLVVIPIIGFFRPTSPVYKFILADKQLNSQTAYVWQGFKTN